MRPLVFFLTLFFSLHVSAFESSILFEKTKRDFGSIDDRRFQETVTKSTFLGETFSFGSLDWKSSLSISELDYSQYTLRMSDGSEHSLESILGESSLELFLDNSLFYYQGEKTFEFQLFSHLNSSPFRKYGGRVKFQQKMNSGLNLFEVDFLYYWQEMPEDYFISYLFENIKRSSLLRSYSLKLGSEVALSEISKIYFSLMMEQKRGERPTHFGAELKYARALNESLFWNFDISQILENKGEPLVDERGYYSYFSIGNSIMWEPFFEVILSMGYVFTRELESDPRIGSELQTGSDSYSLGVDSVYTWGRLVWSMAYTQTNREEELYSLKCTVIWDI